MRDEVGRYYHDAQTSGEVSSWHIMHEEVVEWEVEVNAIEGAAATSVPAVMAVMFAAYGKRWCLGRPYRCGKEEEVRAPLVEQLVQGDDSVAANTAGRSTWRE